jgi:hypothetical protein
MCDSCHLLYLGLLWKFTRIAIISWTLFNIIYSSLKSSNFTEIDYSPADNADNLFLTSINESI